MLRTQILLGLWSLGLPAALTTNAQDQWLSGPPTFSHFMLCDRAWSAKAHHESRSVHPRNQDLRFQSFKSNRWGKRRRPSVSAWHASNLVSLSLPAATCTLWWPRGTEVPCGFVLIRHATKLNSLILLNFDCNNIVYCQGQKHDALGEWLPLP